MDSMVNNYSYSKRIGKQERLINERGKNHSNYAFDINHEENCQIPVLSTSLKFCIVLFCFILFLFFLLFVFLFFALSSFFCNRIDIDFKGKTITIVQSLVSDIVFQINHAVGLKFPLPFAVISY